MNSRLHRIIILILTLTITLPSISPSVDEPAKNVPKTKEERLRELQLERAELTLKQMKASKEEKENDYNSMKTLFDQKLVTIQELNTAKKDMDDAQLAYDQAKLGIFAYPPKITFSRIRQLKPILLARIIIGFIWTVKPLSIRLFSEYKLGTS